MKTLNKTLIAILLFAVFTIPSTAPVKAVAMSDYLENALLDHVFRGRAYTAPTTVYVALMTANADDTGGGTEVTGGSYARVALVANDTNFNNTQGNTTGASTGTDGQIENGAVITFPAPTASWGVVTGWAIYDASSGGNLILHSGLGTNKTINNGDSAPSFPVSSLTNQIDD